MVELFYRERGPAGAPSIVFLHGGGVSGWMWEPQVAALSADYHCLVPDLPGHGRSAKVPLTLENCLDGVTTLIRERAHGGRAHVVGLSFGGQLAALLVADHGELLERAVISGALSRRLGSYKVVRALTPLFMPLNRAEWTVKASAKQLRVPESYLPALRHDLVTTTARATMDLMTATGRFEVLSRLGTARTPTLVLVGEEEKPLSHQSARDYLAAIPGAVGRVAPGVFHLWNLEKPDLFTAAVRAWVAGAELPAELLPLG